MLIVIAVMVLLILVGVADCGEILLRIEKLLRDKK